MPIHEARRSRRELADRLDFVCFISIVLMYGSGAILVAAYAEMSFEQVGLLVVAVLPLGMWLAVASVLRRLLEASDRPQEKRYRRQMREAVLAPVRRGLTVKVVVVPVATGAGRG